MIKKYLEQFTQPIFPFLATGFTNTVLFDATGPSSIAASNEGPLTSPLTFSHTCTGANFLLVGVVIGTVGVDTAFTINSVTYAGQAMTLVPGSSYTTSPTFLAGRLQLYYRLAPTSGTNNVVINYTDTAAPSANECILAGSMSFKNVNQTTPFSNVTTVGGITSATRISVTIASAINNMVVSLASNGSPINTSDNTLTFLKNLNFNTYGSNIAGSISVGFPTTTMAYSVVNDQPAIVALSLNAA